MKSILVLLFAVALTVNALSMESSLQNILDVVDTTPAEELNHLILDIKIRTENERASAMTLCTNEKADIKRLADNAYASWQRATQLKAEALAKAEGEKANQAALASEVKQLEKIKNDQETIRLGKVGEIAKGDSDRVSDQKDINDKIAQTKALIGVIDEIQQMLSDARIGDAPTTKPIIRATLLEQNTKMKELAAKLADPALMEMANEAAILAQEAEDVNLLKKMLQMLEDRLNEYIKELTNKETTNANLWVNGRRVLVNAMNAAINARDDAIAQIARKNGAISTSARVQSDSENDAKRYNDEAVQFKKVYDTQMSYHAQKSNTCAIQQADYDAQLRQIALILNKIQEKLTTYATHFTALTGGNIDKLTLNTWDFTNVAWNPCPCFDTRANPTPVYTHTRTATKCLAVAGGSNTCDPAQQTQTEVCTGRNCPIDCLMSPWELSTNDGWTTCSTLCGPGIQTRKRSIVVSPDFGGKACPGEVFEKRTCEVSVCPEPKLKAKFYQHCPFDGQVLELKPGDYADLAQYYVNGVNFDNIISAIRIPEGLTVQLFSEKQFSGAVRSFVGPFDIMCFTSGYTPMTMDYGYNDQTSSIRVFDSSSLGYRWRPEAITITRNLVAFSTESLNNNQAINTYTVAFNIKQKRTDSYWMTVMQRFTNGNNEIRERSPGIWIHAGTSRLHIRTCVENGGVDPIDGLTIGQWSHVTVVVNGNNHAYYLNGERKQTWTCIPNQNAGPLYVTSPFYNVAQADIKDLRFYVGQALEARDIKAVSEGYLSVYGPTSVSQMKVVASDIATTAIAPRLSAFTTSFFLTMKSAPLATAGIFTRGNAAGDHPQIDIGTDLKLSFFYCESASTSVFTSDALVLKQRYHIAAVASGTTVNFFIDGVNKGKASCNFPTTHGPIYLSDPWTVAANADVLDFRFYSDRALSDDEVKALKNI